MNTNAIRIVAAALAATAYMSADACGQETLECAGHGFKSLPKSKVAMYAGRCLPFGF